MNQGDCRSLDVDQSQTKVHTYGCALQGIKNHVQSELTKAKATRLRSQHAKLRKKLKSMKPEDMKKPFREWIRDVGIPLDTEIRSKEFDAQVSLRGFLWEYSS